MTTPFYGVSNIANAASLTEGVRIEGLDLAEDLLRVVKHFRLSLPTIFLAISILSRVLQSDPTELPQQVFESLKGKMSHTDLRKLLIYMALSLSTKSNERIAFKFEEASQAFNFEAPSDYLKSLLTPKALRQAEFDILRALSFKVGDASSSDQISLVCETIMLSKDILGGACKQVKEQINEAALYLATLMLLVQAPTSQTSLPFTGIESAAASIYMAVKLAEKKTDLKIMTRELFNSILALANGDQTS